MEFNLIFSLVAIVLLHGFNALKIMLILFLNYSVARSFRGSKSGAILTWVFNGAVLLGNEVFEGWRLSQWFESLAWLVGYIPYSSKFRSDSDTPRTRMLGSILAGT